MKKIIFATALCCLFAIMSQAQLQRVQKTQVGVKTQQPIMVNQQLTIVPGATAQPVKVVNIGNGKTITVTLRKNATTGGQPAFTKQNKTTPVTENTGGVTCVTSKVIFTAESTTFMNGNNSNQIRLYPGAIYAFDDFYGGGYNEIITGRNPIRIYTDQPVNVGGTSGIVVNNPTGYDINNGSSGIGLIRNSILQSNSGLGLQYRSFSANSESELALKVTAGGSYGGFSANASYGLNQQNGRYYLTVDVIKPMYTLKAERPSAGFFTDAALNGRNDLMYVKEVTYGTRILANIELILNRREDAASFNASYGQQGGVNFSLGGNFISKSSNTTKTVNTYIIGGPSTTTSFNVDKLEEEIRNYLATCNFQHARPVSYTLGEMNGASCATASATDEYVDRICTPNDIVYKLAGVILNLSTGADNKEYPSQVALELYNRNTSGILFHQPFTANTGEFPINQDKTIGFDRHPHATEQDLTLTSIMQGGLALRIYYKPNWATDAWKIEGASISLLFKDQNGNEPPAGFVPRKITFNNATGFLNNWDHVLTCQTDGSLKPTTSSISQQ